MNTNRLVQIIDRQRQGRIRDIAFAILVALVIVLQVTSLRAAGRGTAMEAPRASSPTLRAPELVPAFHTAGVNADRDGATRCEPTDDQPVC